jgi:nucleotide-binding universal stress UspA family protein
VSFARRCRTVLRSWNGAAPTISQPDSLSSKARAADIIVVGEDGRDALADPFMQANPSDLVMQMGRPRLVVPESGNWLDLRSILIAWKATPEARRAIVDALPMLRKAKDVTVVEIIEDDVSRLAALSRVNDIVAWLSRHGVVASEQVPGECGDAAAQLDKIASEVGAGLVVAGAYGHSRLREWVFGGVTKRLVNPLSRCSLLSRRSRRELTLIKTTFAETWWNDIYVPNPMQSSGSRFVQVP